MRNTIWVVSLLLAMQSCATTNLVNAPPSQPELTFVIYNHIAAQLRWTHSFHRTGKVVYRLERDGKLVYEGDELMFVDGELQLGINNNYTLTATGKDGLVSEPVSVSFNTDQKTQRERAENQKPDDFRAVVQSPTSIQLSWDTDRYDMYAYEIFQDGEKIGQTEGGKYLVDTGLKRDGVYQFEVRALRVDVPTEYDVSTKASLLVDMQLRGPPEPEAPHNVRFVRHSDTAAELFWSHPEPSQIVGTHITRNGNWIASVPGTSYLDDERGTLDGYTYELTAVDTNGVTSRFVRYIDQNDPPLNKPLVKIDASTVEHFIDGVAQVVRGDILDGLFNEAMVIGELNHPGVTLLSAAKNPEALGSISIYECAGGGQIRHERIAVTWTDKYSYLLTPENCKLNGNLYSGRLQYNGSDLRQYIRVGDWKRMRANGDIAVMTGQLVKSDEGVRRDFKIEESSQTMANGLQTLINNIDLTFWLEPEDSRSEVFASLRGNFEFSSDLTNGQVLSAFVATSAPIYSSRYNEDYDRGRIEIELADTARIEYRIDNGDPESFRVTVEQKDSTEKYNIQWDNQNRLLLQTDFARSFEQVGRL